MFRYLVLGLLRAGEAYHGYALMKAYRDRSGVSISTGNFYRELQRLVGEGLVHTASNPPGADARRSPYQITDQGIASFDAWLSSTPMTIGTYDDELSSRAVFIGETDSSEAERLLERWRESVWIYGKTLEREREVVTASPPVGGAFNARSILLARRIKHVAADLEFIEELRNACFPPVVVREAPSQTVATKARARPATAKLAERRAGRVKRRAKTTPNRKK